MNDKKSSVLFFLGVAIGVGVSLVFTAILLFGVIGKDRFREALGAGPIQSVTEPAATGPAVTSLDTKAISGKLTGLEKIVDKYYLNDIDYGTMTEDIYKGALASLGDPYSGYFTADEYKSLMESTTGNYCGIGVSVTKNVSTGAVTVVQVFENGPGAKAGLLPDDIIEKVEGEEVTGLDLNQVVSKIKGEEGTSVNLTVLRGTNEIRMKLTRAQVSVDTVSHEMLDGDIGYIKVSEFEEVTAEQFEKAIDDLEKKGEKSLIIDLRDNPGGRYDTVCTMLDRIVKKGLLVYTEDKYGHKEEQNAVTNESFTKPLVVLVNGNSASASEIFSGCIQDYGIGTIVGTTTFGKGIVQQLIPLTDGSAVKLTVSKYYTPDGRNIHGTGMEPDVTVELDKDAIKDGKLVREKDNQLQKAVSLLSE